MKEVNNSDIDNSLIDAFKSDPYVFGFGFSDFVINNDEAKTLPSEFVFNHTALNTKTLCSASHREDFSLVGMDTKSEQDFDKHYRMLSEMIGKNIVVQPVTFIEQKSVILGSQPNNYPILEEGNLLDELRIDGSYIYDLTLIAPRDFLLKGDVPIQVNSDGSVCFKNVPFIVKGEVNSIILGFSSFMEKD